jgi:thiol:disulfide interchange protein DsbD
VFALFVLALLPGLSGAAVDEDDLLPVDEAFVLVASAPQRDRIELTWTIAKGYYLYRHRMDAQPTDGAFKATVALQLPAGEKHTDEFFGEVETYRGRVGAILAGTAAADAAQATLKVKYQGCADLGVCYPPQTRTVTIPLPPPPQTPDGGLTALGRRLAPGGGASLAGVSPGANEPLPLPPEQAFGFEAIASDGNNLLLRFTPARGYYLYRDRTQLGLIEPPDGRNKAPTMALERPRWPKGVSHHDEHFGDVIVYFDRIDVPLALRRTRPDAETVTLSATFQGCQNEGICYPPMTRTVRVAVPAGRVDASAPASADAAASAITAMAAPAAKDRNDRQGPSRVAPSTAPAAGDTGAETAFTQANPAAQAEDSRIASALAGSNRWWALLGFFGAGLLLAFTPCVLPMIPILSGLIAGQGTRIGTRRALVLSLVYIVANALVFTVAGVVAGLVGANLQVAFQTPWVIVAFSLLFVALALSSFGLYELQLPAVLRARLGSISDKQRGGSLPGVAAMGALSALIVGPCVAPPLAAAVLYIGQSHDPVLGGAALFLLAMGMGMPLLAFGAAAGRGMPTSGPWMTAAQRVFGFVFLALAVWMLSRILPAPVSLSLYGLLALAAAAWAFSAATAPDKRRTRVLARFAGLVLALLGAAELLGALGGGRDPLQPLAGILRGGEVRELPFRKIKSTQDLDREIATAHAQGKPVLFDFYADWCVSCKEMEKYTFTEPSVQAALAEFVLLKADVTANDDLDQALMQRFGIIGPPATLYFSDGRERRELRLIGFEKAPDFVARAQRAAAN